MPNQIFDPTAPLTPTHDLSLFSSGEATLDDWLRQRALKNQALLATRTFVVCAPQSQRVVGYAAVSMGQVMIKDVPGAIRRNMPTQIPAVVLGRLAVDLLWKGNGLGRILLRDVLQRALRLSSEIPARLIIVHPISADAEACYARNGFSKLPSETVTWALDLLKLKNLDEPNSRDR